MDPLILVVVVLALLIIIVLVKTAVVVPQQNAYVVERLGTYSGTLGAGFHVLTPFVDVIRYRHSLKEQTYDIPEQVCITRDNVQVGVDGVLYLKVLNPERASYGITEYRFAIVQLCQTTLRSEIGKIDLDKTFEERATINTQVVNEVDKASEAWGVKVLRYEIKNITPPQGSAGAQRRVRQGPGRFQDARRTARDHPQIDPAGARAPRPGRSQDRADRQTGGCARFSRAGRVYRPADSDQRRKSIALAGRAGSGSQDDQARLGQSARIAKRPRGA